MRVPVLSLLCVLASCATTRATETPELALAATCVHGYPVEECTACHPEGVEAFKARGDWCAEHALPESHCKECHPALKFYQLPPLPEDADLVHLSRMGEDVPALEAHLASGKVTVFDFYAQWCGPCKSIDALVYRELGRRDDLAYRKLNIMAWESPLAQRYLGNAPGLPYVIVFDKAGRRHSVVRDVEALERALESLR